MCPCACAASLGAHALTSARGDGSYPPPPAHPTPPHPTPPPVRDQVKRLMHHPSVVVWSGNNENEQAITQNWFPNTRTDPYTYAVRLPGPRPPLPAAPLTWSGCGRGALSRRPGRLRPPLPCHDPQRPAAAGHVARLPLQVQPLPAPSPFRPFRLDPQVGLVRRLHGLSSPANGVWSTDPFAERWIAPNGDTSTSQFFGDHHYYNYAADSQNVATMVSPRSVGFARGPQSVDRSRTLTNVRIRGPRFSSEYGFQSMPSFFSLEKISLPEVRGLDKAARTRRPLRQCESFVVRGHATRRTGCGTRTFSSSATTARATANPRSPTRCAYAN